MKPLVLGFIALGLVLIVPWLLAQGVKQLSYALHSGSVFAGLREWINDRSRARVPGMTTLNELFTCKLCMTMQVTLWTIFVPGLLLYFWVTNLNWQTNILVSLLWFVLSMGISGVALSRWIKLEFSERRYRDLELKFNELRALQVKLSADTATMLGLHEILPMYGESDANDLLAGLKDCNRIGCGFMRMSCRQETVQVHAQEWSHRMGLGPLVAGTLYKHLKQTTGGLRTGDVRKISQEDFYERVKKLEHV